MGGVREESVEKMILTKDVYVCWHYSNKEYYQSLTDNEGKYKYKFTKYKDEFLVDFDDISEKSGVSIQVECDYCGKVEDRIYRNWRYHYDKSPVKKDACTKCRGKKIAESNLIEYGTANVMQVKKFKENLEKTNMKKYGTKNAGSSKQVQEKIKRHNLEKYGAEYYFQTNDFKEKYTNTMQEKYGVNNSFQAEEVKEKSRRSMLENWGVEYNMQHPDIRKKAVKTMYEHSSTPTSKPQLYLHKVYGGELNYPFERYNLDIAFPKEKIVIEYDGGAHDLKVKLGGISEDDFNRREIIRSTYLKLGGWKLIKIKSQKDNLPIESTLRKMLRDAREIFLTGRSWVTFCIDNETIEYRNTIEKYNYISIENYNNILKKI